MIGDMLGGCGSATGVDLSMERCSACRTVLSKYAVPGCRLFRGDATTFDLPPPNLVCKQASNLLRHFSAESISVDHAGQDSC